MQALLVWQMHGICQTKINMDNFAASFTISLLEVESEEKNFGLVAGDSDWFTGTSGLATLKAKLPRERFMVKVSEWPTLHHLDKAMLKQ